MELGELKYQLNQKLATDHASRTDADIAALLKKKTSSVISKLKRSLIIEMILCVLFAAAMLYVVVVSSYWSIRLYFGVFTVLMFGFTFILYYLYQRTQKLTDSQQPGKANLQAVFGIICISVLYSKVCVLVQMPERRASCRYHRRPEDIKEQA